jgi:AraC-like DNA-binding protein
MGYNELKQHGTLDFPIQLYHVDKNHPKFEMASHWHQGLEIIRILDGTLEIKLDNNEYIAGKGDVVFVNSEVIHSALPTQDCVYECIVMNLEMLFTKDEASKYFIESILNLEYKIEEFIPSSNTVIKSDIDNLFSAMNNMSSGYKFTVIGSLYQLFGTIIDNHLYKSSHYDNDSLKDKSIPKLKKALSYIRSNYDKPISLEDMAEYTEMSPKYFCSFFKKMTLKTPMEYLKAYRIERASRKLLNTDQSVTDIAYSSGFNDLSYFIKTFKEVKGVTPQKFRNT